MNRVRPTPGVPKVQRDALQKVGQAYADDVVASPSKLGPEGMLMDMGPRLQGQGGAVAAGTGTGASTTTGRLERRSSNVVRPMISGSPGRICLRWTGRRWT